MQIDTEHTQTNTCTYMFTYTRRHTYLHTPTRPYIHTYTSTHTIRPGRLRGLAVACWTTCHYHPCSNLGVGIYEGCFIFTFASLPLDVARPIQPTMYTKVAVKHQSSSYNQTSSGIQVHTYSEVDLTSIHNMELRMVIIQQQVTNTIHMTFSAVI